MSIRLAIILHTTCVAASNPHFHRHTHTHWDPGIFQLWCCRGDVTIQLLGWSPSFVELCRVSVIRRLLTLWARELLLHWHNSRNNTISWHSVWVSSLLRTALLLGSGDQWWTIPMMLCIYNVKWSYSGNWTCSLKQTVFSTWVIEFRGKSEKKLVST